MVTVSLAIISQSTSVCARISCVIDTLVDQMPEIHDFKNSLCGFVLEVEPWIGNGVVFWGLIEEVFEFETDFVHEKFHDWGVKVASNVVFKNRMAEYIFLEISGAVELYDIIHIHKDTL